MLSPGVLPARSHPAKLALDHLRAALTASDSVGILRSQTELRALLADDASHQDVAKLLMQDAALDDALCALRIARGEEGDADFLVESAAFLGAVLASHRQHRVRLAGEECIAELAAAVADVVPPETGVCMGVLLAVRFTQRSCSSMLAWSVFGEKRVSVCASESLAGPRRRRRTHIILFSSC